MSAFALETETPDGLTFTIRDVDLSVVNALRRTLLADIPIPAIRFRPNEPSNDNVTFVTNTCCLNNEFLGQRLSMIPLCFSELEIDTFDPKVHKFVIREHNKTEETVDVTTKHMKIVDQDGAPFSKELHARVLPADPVTGDHLLITKLKPNHYDHANGEQLHIDAYAAVGTAKECAGFSAVSLATFENVVDKDLADKMLAAKLENSKEGDAKIEEVTHDFDNLDRYRYYKTNKHGDPNEFLFKLETTCGMTCKALVRKALMLLVAKMQRVANGNTPMTAMKASNNMFTVTLSEMNHTDGSLLQSHIYNECVREPVGPATFVGYNMPHPLEETIVLRIALTGQDSTDDALQFVRDHAEAVKKEIAALITQWDVVVGKKAGSKQQKPEKAESAKKADVKEAEPEKEADAGTKAPAEEPKEPSTKAEDVEPGKKPEEEAEVAAVAEPPAVKTAAVRKSRAKAVASTAVPKPGDAAAVAPPKRSHQKKPTP